MDYFAHSARDDIPAQPYSCHINEVIRRTKENVAAMIEYFSGEKDSLKKSVIAAANFHDLGKLTGKNQKILSSQGKIKPLPIKHWDAGSAHMMDQQNPFSACIIYGHHAGLFSRSEETKKGLNKLFRVFDPVTFEDTNNNLYTFITAHNEQIKNESNVVKWESQFPDGITLRLSLSCIVDADHGDTAKNYKNEKPLPQIELRWQERLNALNKYIKELQKCSPKTKRNELRDEIYNICKNSTINEKIVSCDAPVGTGKTTAIMAYLLQKAIKYKLRHIFIILPYTNIINQSVEIYREALTLPGENPEELVAAHHHLVEFDNNELRGLTTLWKSPIIVTTAVQFFETVACCETTRLRKFHELPGSAIFVDEAHACMPAALWPQHWTWINELSNNWNCHYVLASGSLSRFWEIPEFVPLSYKVPDIISQKIRDKANSLEKQRVRIKKCSEALNKNLISKLINSIPGPRLVIANTVQSAAVIAFYLREKGHDVIHISTALAPIHRQVIIEKIKKRLENKQDNDWTLVATSCVEAGVNFSFRSAFRESSSIASLLQVSGRVNRDNEYEYGELYCYRTLDSMLNKHPAFEASSFILDNFLDEGLFGDLMPADLVTKGLQSEIAKGLGRKLSERILKAEKGQEYPDVNDLCKIIKNDTRLVLVDQSIIKSMMDKSMRKTITNQQLTLNSVQMWGNKIEALGISSFPFSNEIYYLDEASYDANFLGYMKRGLDVIKAGLENFYIV